MKSVNSFRLIHRMALSRPSLHSRAIATSKFGDNAVLSRMTFAHGSYAFLKRLYAQQRPGKIRSSEVELGSHSGMDCLAAKFVLRQLLLRLCLCDFAPHKIQTHTSLKRTLFIRTTHNMRIFGVIPFVKLQNDT